MEIVLRYLWGYLVYLWYLGDLLLRQMFLSLKFEIENNTIQVKINLIELDKRNSF